MRYAVIGNGEGTVVPVHSMNVYGEWRSWMRWVVSFNFWPLNFPHPPSRKLGGPQFIWTVWRKNLKPATTRNHDSSVALASIVTMQPHSPPPPKKPFIRYQKMARITKTYYVSGSNTFRSHITKFKKQCFRTEICSYNYALHLYTCCLFV